MREPEPEGAAAMKEEYPMGILLPGDTVLSKLQCVKERGEGINISFSLWSYFLMVLTV